MRTRSEGTQYFKTCWDLFRKAATYDHARDFEEYIGSVCYISKCINVFNHHTCKPVAMDL